MLDQSHNSTLQPEYKQTTNIEEEHQTESVFDGFVGFSCYEDWYIVGAFVNNLAEYKVIEYILRHCWDTYTEITTEQFMHGYINEDGTKTDYGTGLSKPSVIAGIRKAEQHGLIEVDTDDQDKSAIRKFYRVHIDQVDVKNLYPTQDETEPDVNDLYTQEGDVKDFDRGAMSLEPDLIRGKASLPPSNNSNSMPIDITTREIFRIRTSDVKIVDSTLQEPHKYKGKYPDFLKSRIEQFSQILGDHEHIPSNIGQAHHIYLAYLASGGTPETFISAMQQARETAQQATCIRKKNRQGMPNRMPLYFSCLRNLLKVGASG